MTLKYLTTYLRMQTWEWAGCAEYHRGMQAPCATQVLWKDRSGWSGKRMAFRRRFLIGSEARGEWLEADERREGEFEGKPRWDVC